MMKRTSSQKIQISFHRPPVVCHLVITGNLQTPLFISRHPKEYFWMKLGNLYLCCFLGDDYAWKCWETNILWYVKSLSTISTLRPCCSNDEAEPSTGLAADSLMLFCVWTLGTDAAKTVLQDSASQGHNINLENNSAENMDRIVGAAGHRVLKTL